MEWIKQALVLLLAVLLVAGCSPGSGASSPEAVVMQAQGQSLQQLQILSVRVAGNRGIVLYSGAQRQGTTGEGMHLLGYTLVSRSGAGWRAENSGWIGSSAPPEPAEVLQLGVGTTRTPTEVRSIAYGRALNPQIASVEVTFDNGEAVRDEMTNGVFAAVMIGAEQACGLRAFDADGAEVPLPVTFAGPLSPDC
jgi:hypothetical protein